MRRAEAALTSSAGLTGIRSGAFGGW